MKVKNIICLTLIIYFTAACSIIKDAWNFEANIKKIELGMSKKEVIALVGTDYEIVGAEATPSGDIETISYIGGIVDNYRTYYILNFENKKLVEWHKDRRKLPRQPSDKQAH